MCQCPCTSCALTIVVFVFLPSSSWIRQGDFRLLYAQTDTLLLVRRIRVSLPVVVACNIVRLCTSAA
jgi:hypothetical protein